MLRLYRSLLYLYPAAHRQEFGDEMTAVFTQVVADAATQGLPARASLFVRETAGLLSGAMQQHVRALSGATSGPLFPMRRFTVHDKFRFPKSTAVLMTIILAGVILAIEKGEAIEASPNPLVGPIQPVHSTLLPGVFLGLALFYAAGLIGWAVLYALRRSGLHRLDDASATQK
jgi:hypothetical protein